MSPGAARRTGLGAAALAGVTFLVLIWWPSVGKIAAGANDFLAFYAGARLVGTPELYDPAAAARVEHEAAGMTGPALRYIRLPYWAVVLWPLGRMSYPAAYAVFQAVSLAALAGFVLLWPGNRGAALVACCWSVPVSAAFASGQDVFFLLLWITLAVRWQERRPWAAGMVLALCAAKFHLFLPLPLLLAAQRRWRMAAGLAAGGAVLAALSFAAAGADWPVRLLATLASPAIEPGETVMPTLRGLFAGVPGRTAWEPILAAACLVFLWMAARRADFATGFAATLTAGLLIGRHAYPADCTLLIPAALLVMARAPAPRLRWFAIGLLVPVWYLILMANTPAGRLVPLGMFTLLACLAAEAFRARQRMETYVVS